jgi:hydroxymethylbilane synthase
MDSAPIRIGTRRSALALAQASWVAELLREASGRSTELVKVTTHGDVSRASLATIGGTGVFASALREGLLRGDYELAVHSYKDLPAVEPDELTIAAVPARADPRDVICTFGGRTLAELPAGARVGTGSPRRAAQLARRRADLEIVDLRGNVDTRLRKVQSGDLDGVVLAAAGLERLGIAGRISEHFDLETWPTAPAQGAVAVEATPACAVLAECIDLPRDRLAVAAERAVLAGLGAGCAAPVAVASRWDGELLELAVHVFADHADADLQICVQERVDLDDEAAEQVGLHAAERLLQHGASAVIQRAQDVRARNAPLA